MRSLPVWADKIEAMTPESWTGSQLDSIRPQSPIATQRCPSMVEIITKSLAAEASLK